MYMTDSDGPSPESSRHFKRMRKADGWLRERHDSSKAELQQWNALGLPAHCDIVGSFLQSNNAVFGVPDKTELYRLDALTKESDKIFAGSPEAKWNKVLRLYYVEPSPIEENPLKYTLAHPPIGVGESEAVEVNYNVRLSAIVRSVHLVNIHIIHGSPTNDDFGIVFEGAEFPAPEDRRRIRVVRITTLGDGQGTWEMASETKY
jgi:hypothetical protein